MRTAAIMLAVPLVAALAACGGTTSESANEASAAASAAEGMLAEATTGAQTPAPTGSGMPGASATGSPRDDLDACGLLPPAEVESIIGYSATGQALNSGSDAYGIDACTWGGPDKGEFMSIQVFTPGQIDDPIGVLLGASGATPQPVDSLPDGSQWPLGALPGGGGQGVTYTFTTGGKQAAVSLLGSDVTPDQQEALLTAAQKVAGQLEN